MNVQLSETEARIIGALIEKQVTTPEYYPLTMNALIAACNQKSNREPVVAFDESTVQKALDHLRDRNLAYVFYGSTSRVPKYKQMFTQALKLEPSETAILCVLMLRGPQTVGELRERTGRLWEFAGIGDVSATLDALEKRENPLILKLERQVGQKEARYAHLVCGEIDITKLNFDKPAPSSGQNDRITALEEEVASLKSELEALKATFEEFKTQFE